MHSTYLPLPSHTQFVELVVKDAKEVSSTDRLEEHCTWMAIAWSATPLGKSKSANEDLSFNANNILAVLKSSVDRATPHEHWGKHQVDNAHDARLAQIQHSLQRGNFKNDRIKAKRNNVDELEPKCKRPNVAQQQKAQELTPAVTGLIPCDKLVKKRNMEDLQDKLLCCGVEPQDVPKSITDRKKMLQDLESQRLLDAGIEQQAATEQSKKHFLKQSDAPFKLTNHWLPMVRLCWLCLLLIVVNSILNLFLCASTAHNKDLSHSFQWAKQSDNSSVETNEFG